MKKILFLIIGLFIMGSLKAQNNDGFYTAYKDYEHYSIDARDNTFSLSFDPATYSEGHFCIDIFNKASKTTVTNNCIKIDGSKVFVKEPIFFYMLEQKDNSTEIRETIYLVAIVVGTPYNHITARVTENGFDSSFNNNLGYLVTEGFPVFNRMHFFTILGEL